MTGFKSKMPKQITWISNTAYNSKVEYNCQLFLIGLYSALLLVSVSTTDYFMLN